MVGVDWEGVGGSSGECGVVVRARVGVWHRVYPCRTLLLTEDSVDTSIKKLSQEAETLRWRQHGVTSYP